MNLPADSDNPTADETVPQSDRAGDASEGSVEEAEENMSAAVEPTSIQDDEVAPDAVPTEQVAADDEAAGDEPVVDGVEEDDVEEEVITAAETVGVVSAPVPAPMEMEAAPASAAESPSEPMLWYVLKVQSNRERTIKDSLLRRIRRDGLERFFGEIVIPTEKVVETKNGKKRTTERKLYPGYIMVNMVLNDETWYLVRDTGGVGDFTGAAGKPLPMREEEISALLNRQTKTDEGEPAKVKIAFARGDTVKIKEGTFESFEGSIEAVDEASGKVSVLIEIFGRSTPVELEHWQVERV